MSLFGMMLYAFRTNNHDSNTTIINQKRFPDSLFRSGDIIFRDGRGFLSMAFRKMSLISPEYSHAGIIHREGEKVFVYHVIGGEGNQTNLMRKEPLNNFCSPQESNSFGVYRSDLNGKQIDSLAGYYFSKRLNFDTKFDLSSDDKMYCTELVYRILINISGKNNFIPLTTLSGVDYVACDNIFLSPHMTKVFSSINKLSDEK